MARWPRRRGTAGICAQRSSTAASSKRNFAIASRLTLTLRRPRPVGAFVAIYTIGHDPRRFASSRAAITERNMRGNT